MLFKMYELLLGTIVRTINQHTFALLIIIVKSREGQFSIQFLPMLHRRFADMTHGLLRKYD